MTVMRLAEATPVVLAATAVPSNGGATLTVDLDVAVLDGNGSSLETLTASDFKLVGCDDTWAPCVIDGNLAWVYYGSYNASTSDSTFVPVPVTARPTIAAAILLEQSARMAIFDANGTRIEAVRTFFDSITPPDSVTLASFQGSPGTPALTTYGGFTSDGSAFHATLDSLAGRESGTNPIYNAIGDMIAFTAANTAAGSSALQRSVVVVNSDAEPDADCGARTCQQTLSDDMATARSTGISVIAVGPWFSSSLIAVNTGGAIVSVRHPTQLQVVFGSLGKIVGQTLAHNRVHVVLQASEPGTFIQGRYALATLSIRVGTDTDAYMDFPIPI